MRWHLSSKIIVALLAVMLVTAGCSNSTPVEDSGSQSSNPTVSFDEEPANIPEDLESEFKVITPSSSAPEVSVTYEPLETDGEVVGSEVIMAFLNDFLKYCKEDPAGTRCSSEVQEVMKQNPTAAETLTAATPIYIQTQAEMENKVFIRFAYDTATDTISDLFTFETVEGAVQLTEPDKLAAFVSGGVYAAN